jgi:hypothetical protein
MAITLSNDALNTLKNTVDTAGYVNEASRFLLELLDLQYKNIFEIILYPEHLTENLSISTIGTALLDSTIAKLYIQSISLPFKKLEYESADIVYFVKNITKPTDCTISFIENDVGIVRSYLKSWQREIIVSDPFFGYRIRNNQLQSKKNAVILPQSGSQIPSPNGTIKMEGLKFKEIADITMGHNESEPMLIEATFSIDNVYWTGVTDFFE